MSEGEPGGADGRPPSRQPGRRVRRSEPNVSSHHGSQEELHASAQSKPLDVKMTVQMAAAAVAEAPAAECAAMECAVCLQTCVHPVRLPCSHIFCYLCVKGVAFQSKRCAMCRQEIPADFLLHPQLLDRTQLERESALDDGYQWFYEGRNGWWQYDGRTAAGLEEAYQSHQGSAGSTGSQPVEILIAGATYVIDLQRWVQYAKERPGRIRKIKRDVAVAVGSVLGVAGLRRQGGGDTLPSASSTD